MATVQNVIFDLGGVLLDWNPGKILERCYADTASRNAVRDALFRHEDWLAFNRGDLRQRYDFWDAFLGIVISGEDERRDEVHEPQARESSDLKCACHCAGELRSLSIFASGRVEHDAAASAAWAARRQVDEPDPGRSTPI